MKRSKWIGLAGFILFCMLATAGCSENTPSSVKTTQQKDKITVWAWDENYNILAVKTAIVKYQSVHPDVEFEVVTMSQEETVAKLNSALLTNNRESLPDIVLIEDYRIQKFLKDYQSFFSDLSDIAAPEDFVAYKTEINQMDGVLYGIPFDSGVVGMFYRLDYIQAAGYTDADMHNITWEQYIEIGKKVMETTGKYMLTLNPNDLPIIRMILQSDGSWYTDDSGDLNLAKNKTLVSAIQVYKDIVDAGIAEPVADWDQFIQSFQNGETATVISGSWISSSILEMENQSRLWRVAELPGLYGDSDVTASSVGGSGWYVIKGTEDEQEAKQFLKETFASDTELVNELVEKINLVTSLKNGTECENYQKGVAFYGDQKIFEDFYEWTSLIPTVNYGDSTYEIEKYVADAIQKVLAGEEIKVALSECEISYRSK